MDSSFLIGRALGKLGSAAEVSSYLTFFKKLVIRDYLGTIYHHYLLKLHFHTYELCI